jgi:hypothetical protein
MYIGVYCCIMCTPYWAVLIVVLKKKSPAVIRSTALC